jgi:uncharacterized protein with von Willebrand factor type A (vWA) domain
MAEAPDEAVDATARELLPAPILERLVAFGRAARASGLAVGTGRILSFCRAVAALDAFDPTDLRVAAGTTLVSRPEDAALLDTLFDRFFAGDAPVPPPENRTAGEEGRPDGTSRPMTGQRARGSITPAWTSSEVDGGEGSDEQSAIRIVASDAEVLRRKDFAELSEDERRRAMAIVRRLTLSLPFRSSRRYRRAAGGERFDMRTTLRRSMRTEGEPFRRAWVTRETRRRPLVLILDVSGSMAPYSRALVHFAHSAAATGRRVEVFCFGTRLTRITAAVRNRDPIAAMRAAAAAVGDWEGGTRIGHSLKELLDTWGSRSALRGSVVVLCSDGLERGDPELLARQMQRLRRLARRVVWVNPLKGSPRYEPLARGMAASLPHVDLFLPGHNVESLEALAEAVAGT